MISAMKNNSSDDFQTPVEALEPLFSYLNKDWVIWECACGKGNLVKGLKDKGYNVIGTDLLTGHDFLEWQPDSFDCIITNPPYSIKQKFLERAYELSKPFALLLPLTTFETPKRQALFKKYGLEVIFFDKRINFQVPEALNTKKTGSWFATAWFTNKLNIGKSFQFYSFKSPIKSAPLAEQGAYQNHIIAEENTCIDADGFIRRSEW